MIYSIAISSYLILVFYLQYVNFHCHPLLKGISKCSLGIQLVGTAAIISLLCVVSVFESFNSSAVLNVKWQHPKGHVLPAGF